MTDENDTDPEVYIITFSIIGIVLIAIFTCVLVYLIMMKKKPKKTNNNNMKLIATTIIMKTIRF